MKLIEIKCPSCGGNLKVKDSQTKLITCEFCGNQFFLDDEKVQNITNYNIYQTQPAHHMPGGNGYRWVFLVLLFVGFIFILVIWNGAGSTSHSSYTVPAYPNNVPDMTTDKGGSNKTAPRSPLFNSMVAKMFGKDASLVSDEDLARVKYLKVETFLNNDQVQYSFDDPYGEKPLIQTSSFDSEDWNWEDIAAFTGLIKVDLESSAKAGIDLKKLTALKGITADGMELQTIAAAVADPGQITELDLKGITTLDGLFNFSNLEQLSAEDLPAANLKELVPLKKLKALKLVDTVDSEHVSFVDEDKPRVTDYSAISVMKGIESVYLKSDNIKDIGFLKDLPALSSLTLDHTSIISLEALDGMPGLKSLTLTDNNKVQDYNAVSRVQGLTELTLNKLTSQPDPSLSALTQLQKLDISGFMSIASLGGLTGLQDLSIHSCNLDSASVLSSLTGVERLTLYSVWNSEGNLRSLSFLDGMTGLKYADFNGNLDGTGWNGYLNLLEVYGDVSSIFNHPGLEELYLDNGKFEINFDKIKENPSLRVLSLKNLVLHKNYHVKSYGGGLSDIWYDDDKLADHLDALARFPNLETLSLDGNQLTDISFATKLKKLTRLNLGNNYITDLAPLAQLENLRYVDVRDNPLGNAGNLGDGVTVVQ